MYDPLKQVDSDTSQTPGYTEQTKQEKRLDTVLTLSKEDIHVDKSSLEDGTLDLDENDDNCNVIIEDDTDFDSPGCCARYVDDIDSQIKAFIGRNKRSINRGLKALFSIAYFTYFGYCMYYSFGDQQSITLLTITLFAFTKISWNTISSHIPSLSPKTMSSLHSKKALRIRTILRYGLYLATTVGFGLFFGLKILQENPQNLQSLIGIAAFIIICFFCSTAPGKIKWHPVFWGFAIQFAFASLTLRTKVGYDIFQWLGDRLQDFLHFSDKGSAFVLGPNFDNMGLAFWLSGLLIFFNAVLFVLNQLGVIEFIVLKLGMFLHHCLGTGPVESVIAAANIFLGLAEAPLLVRPYLGTVTRSELNAIMTCGFASIAGGAMAMFIRSGAPANHLLTAAIISAPSALAITKVLCPETEKINYDKQKNIRMLDSDKTKKNSILQACSEGALQAIPLLVGISANMLAFYSILAMMDAVLDWMGRRAGFEGLTFDFLCSFVLFPVAYAMGVPVNDCGKVGTLIGIKLFATPVAGYATLGDMIENRNTYEQYIANTNGSWHWSGQDVILDDTNTTLVRGFMSVRGEVIATYAMCGFSAFTAIGISMGCLIPMCPERKDDIIELVMLAFLGGNIASFATGSVAGMMYTAF